MMSDQGDQYPSDGRPTTHHHPRGDVLGAIIDAGPDRLLERLLEVHREPRPDIPPELARRNPQAR